MFIDISRQTVTIHISQPLIIENTYISYYNEKNSHKILYSGPYGGMFVLQFRHVRDITFNSSVRTIVL
jgi:hypothetical protein